MLKFDFPKNEPLRDLIVIAIALCVIVVCVGMFMFVASGVPPMPLPPNDRIDYGSHPVVFIVVDIWGDPLPSMLIECIHCNQSQYETTNEHGRSRQFLLVGRNHYEVSVYNETMDLQKAFRLHPVRSHYHIVLEQ